MSDIAIKVENLSKLYKIGLAKNRHDTLRDQLTHAVRASLRHALSALPWSRNGHGAGVGSRLFVVPLMANFGRSVPKLDHQTGYTLKVLAIARD